MSPIVSSIHSKHIPPTVMRKSSGEIVAYFRTKKIQRCRLGPYACELCPAKIVPGERYFEGGFRRRAHEKCVRALRLKTETGAGLTQQAPDQQFGTS